MSDQTEIALRDLISSTAQQQHNLHLAAKTAGDPQGSAMHAYAAAVLKELMEKAGVK